MLMIVCIYGNGGKFFTCVYLGFETTKKIFFWDIFIHDTPNIVRWQWALHGGAVRASDWLSKGWRFEPQLRRFFTPNLAGSRLLSCCIVNRHHISVSAWAVWYHPWWSSMQQKYPGYITTEGHHWLFVHLSAIKPIEKKFENLYWYFNQSQKRSAIKTAVKDCGIGKSLKLPWHWLTVRLVYAKV